jgi:hypothetical protein
MARFLSPAWFDELPEPPASLAPPEIVIEQVVTATPDGEVRYRVAMADGAAYVSRPDDDRGAQAATNGSPPADLVLTTDWATATAIVRGELSTQAALMTGRLHVRGNLARLTGRAADLLGVDPVPAAVRQRTTF